MAVLTLGLIWAEKTSERELDGAGWSSGRRQWRTEFCSSISAGERLEQARDGTEWGRGEVAQLGVRRIEAGRRAVAGATNGGDSSSCSAQQLGKGIGMD